MYATNIITESSRAVHGAEFPCLVRPIETTVTVSSRQNGSGWNHATGYKRGDDPHSNFL